MPSCSCHKICNFGDLLHPYSLQAPICNALRYSHRPFGRGGTSLQQWRQDETLATKDLFLVLTPKVRKTTLSCLLEGKHNPSFWSILTASFQGWDCALSHGNSSSYEVIQFQQDFSRLLSYICMYGKDPPFSIAQRISVTATDQSQP